MSMDHLITDRTSSDVQRWRTLHDKGWAVMNDAERTEWLAEMKGRYDYRDWNRVEAAAKTLYQKMRDLGYLPSVLTFREDWTRDDIPTREDWSRYFTNVAAMKAAIPLLSSTPAVPTLGDKLNFQRANDLEQILVDIEYVTTQISNSWCYAGDIYLGEV